MPSWLYRFTATTTMPNRRTRTISFVFDGSGDARLNAQVELRKRLRMGRSEHAWYGVGYTISGMLGTKYGTIECVDGAMRLIEDK